MNGNRGPASARKAAQIAEEEERISFDWIAMKLIDESRDIHAALEEYRESGSDDWTVALTLWSLQWEGFQLVAVGHPDPSVRERFEAALAERRRVMDGLLARIHRQGKRANGHG